MALLVVTSTRPGTVATIAVKPCASLDAVLMAGVTDVDIIVAVVGVISDDNTVKDDKLIVGATSDDNTGMGDMVVVDATYIVLLGIDATTGTPEKPERSMDIDDELRACGAPELDTVIAGTMTVVVSVVMAVDIS